MTYRDAGVDIDAGHALVNAIKPLVAATKRPGADGSLGGFGGLFDLKAAGFSDPVLVAATDGVGTKLKIAAAMNDHAGIGIDLVAMCVNDLIVQGAEPLFFLDYFATAKLEPETAVRVIAGIAEGCKQAGCALIGGETAEMPGVYHAGEYDLAGFAVGAAERNNLLPGADPVREGDLILGLASSGLHSNGFSLVRTLIDSAGLDYNSPAPFDPDQTLGQILLRPTQIYIKQVIGAIHANKLKALSHITGGGITDNVPRSLPDGVLAEIDLESWPLPPLFAWLEETGNLGDEELLRTFNCGIGMILITPKENAPLLKKSFSEAGETIYEIGVIRSAAKPDAPPGIKYQGRLALNA